MAQSRLRILFVTLEFFGWEQARPWSYTAQFALEEGFSAANVEFVTVPAIGNFTADSRASWLYHLKRLFAGERFDQVWVTIPHIEYDDSFWSWAKEIAPIQVGWVVESMTYDEELCRIDPRMAARSKYIEEQLAKCTHALVIDEVDETALNSKGIVKAKWWSCGVPGRFVAERIKEPTRSESVFYGVPYNERMEWIKHPALQGKMVVAKPPGEDRRFPERFDRLNHTILNVLEHAVPSDRYFLDYHTTKLRELRREIYDSWMEALPHWNAVVNLPTMGKMLSTRVYEAMAVGTPVICWKPPERPRTTGFFTDGVEILYFNSGEFERVADYIHRLQSDRSWRMWLAENGRNCIRAEHTTENRIKQALEWIR